MLRKGTRISSGGTVSVHALVVVDVQTALLYAEKELRLVGVVDRLSGPYGYAVVVEHEGGGVYLFELARDGRAFYHLAQTGGKYVVLHLHAVRPAVSVHAREPFLHALVQPYARTVLEQLLERGIELALGLLAHGVHIGEVHVHAVLLGQAVGLPPEFVHVAVHALYVTLRLHIVRRKRLVEIVTHRQHGQLALRKSFVCHDVLLMPPPVPDDRSAPIIIHIAPPVKEKRAT